METARVKRASREQICIAEQFPCWKRVVQLNPPTAGSVYPAGIRAILPEEKNKLDADSIARSSVKLGTFLLPHLSLAASEQIQMNPWLPGAASALQAEFLSLMPLTLVLLTCMGPRLDRRELL